MTRRTFRELRKRTDAPPGSAWGLWGDDDQCGTVNLLTPERVLAGAGSIREGLLFPLDIPLDAFDPALVKTRGSPTHVIEWSDDRLSDRLDDYYLQNTTQIDGLRHVRHPDFGFYNGVPDADVAEGTAALGIQNWAQHGLVGRGVLVDVARHLANADMAFDPTTARAITLAELTATIEAQGSELRPGDMLLLRTGWLASVLGQSDEQRMRFRGSMASAGLEQSEDLLAWLWDEQLSVVAADNLAVEVFPVPEDSPFVLESERRSGLRTAQRGMLHRMVIPLLGMALGELWNFEELARHCAATATWDCMVVACPLALVGGVGSPANAIAIK
jgi:kynurenine formamidase